MARLCWDDKYLTGYPDVDDQHRGIFQRVNELHDAAASRNASELTGEALAFLIQYTLSHFRCEEDAMAAVGYPDRDAHKDLHDAFSSKIRDLSKRYQRGERDLWREISDAISHWLTDHILKHDMALAAYFREASVGNGFFPTADSSMEEPPEWGGSSPRGDASMERTH